MIRENRVVCSVLRCRFFWDVFKKRTLHLIIFYSILAAQLVLPFKETSKWRDLLKLRSNARWVRWLNQGLVSLFYAIMSQHQCKATCSHPLHKRREKSAFCREKFVFKLSLCLSQGGYKQCRCDSIGKQIWVKIRSCRRRLKFRLTRVRCNSLREL